MFCAYPDFPAFFYYFSSSTKCNTVVPVPWLPKVTQRHVIPRECALRNHRRSGGFSPEMTSSVGLPLENMGMRMRERKYLWGAL
jgi:hypothetical protein